MNKKLFIGGCGLAAIAGNVFAADEEYSYFTPCVALKGGYSLLGKRDDIKYKGGFAGAVEMGVAYDAWRFGVEVGYKSNNIKNFKLPGGEQGTNFRLTGGYDFVLPGGAALTQTDVANAAAYSGELARVRSKSVSEFWNNNFDGAAGAADVFGVPVANGHDGVILKNVSYLNLKKMSALTGMFNVCYDYAMTDAWSLYAGLGLGVARVNLTALTAESKASKSILDRVHALGGHAAAVVKKAVLENLPKFFDAKDITKTEISKTVFAWQLMAGVAYEINENWKLTFGYKFFNTGKVDFNGTKIKTPRNHTAEAGLILSF